MDPSSSTTASEPAAEPPTFSSSTSSTTLDSTNHTSLLGLSQEMSMFLALVGVPSVICIILVACGLYTLLKKRKNPPTTYSAAVQNRDFFDSTGENLRCLNCHLIEMGSMACYTETCPSCGRPPPV